VPTATVNNNQSALAIMLRNPVLRGRSATLFAQGNIAVPHDLPCRCPFVRGSPVCPSNAGLVCYDGRVYIEKPSKSWLHSLYPVLIDIGP
jgi:hypothetical protein